MDVKLTWHVSHPQEQWVWRLTSVSICANSKMSESLLNEEIKWRIHRMYAFFVTDVDAVRLSDWLKQEMVISIDQWQMIYAQNPTPNQKCRALLDFLLCSNIPKAFIVVREALRKENHYLFQFIDDQNLFQSPGKLKNEEFDQQLQREQRKSRLMNGFWIQRCLEHLESPRHSEATSVRHLVEQLEAADSSHIRAAINPSQPIKSRVSRLSDEIRILKQRFERECQAPWKTFNRATTETVTPQIYHGEAEKLKEENQRLKQELQNKDEELIKLQAMFKEESNPDASKNGYKSDFGLTYALATKAAEKGKRIRCLTIMGSELFIIHGDSYEIEVYNSTTFSFSRSLTLDHENSSIFEHMSSCSRQKCLYVMCEKGRVIPKEILKVDEFGKLLKKWPVGDDSGCLSVAKDCNVILTVHERSKLNEYSPDGRLIREVLLSKEAGILHPWHALKLVSGDYLISHGSQVYKDPLHRVCIVDVNGNIMCSFGGRRGPSTKQVDYPRYLAADDHGYVFVNDARNSRVILLDPHLKFVKTIVSRERDGLRSPRCLLLDEGNWRLLVADNEALQFEKVVRNGRVLIFGQPCNV